MYCPEESLKTKSLDRIKSELQTHISFREVDSNKQFQVLDVPTNPNTRKFEEVAVTTLRSECLKPSKKVSQRMKLFLSMSPDDVKPKNEKRKLACEKELHELPKPVDRIRCPSCKILRLREEHIKHVKVCKGTAPRIQFGCTDCSYKNSDIQDLREHIKNVHNKETKKKIGKSSLSKENTTVKVKRARQKGTEENLSEVFMCTNCTKTYRLKHSLVRHRRFECGQEPRYPCCRCGKRFKHKYDLKIHERSRHCFDTTHDGNIMSDITNSKMY
ncbi:hypothetical protein WA026_020861 [Henosepilachna vigintioctopunctata]|uniref:C2H2-type domain-containing protein n=1 Tax=Henosepilachna vigintioctopunctata TaxID=420089 RepID=A0AAW1UNG5_9CUCU